MNSYPAEFLSHAQPLMFVGGLGVAPAPQPTTTSPQPSPGPATSGRKPSNSELPLMSPEAVSASLPSEPEVQDEFVQLATDLKSALAPYTAPPRVWVGEEDRRDFRVMLVDKGVRLPIRKLPEGHSPLSPLTPSSPLYPDGLIAPVWVRKHTELVPSVFVLFLRLYEAPRGQPMGDSEERQRERDADEATVREISERRRRLGERGIKLTVVLMATAATLDADGLDQRLSAIRRASQLSAKASLFVLTPVKASELPDFVKSLMGALYEPAMEYYAAHGKRVRRKRGRGPPSGNRSRSNSTAAGNRSRAGSHAAHPLSAQGWTIRYDWKAGWFAEVRGELDLARRHYEDCWNELARMFGSTSTLPPRTKRWAEAKVLADCLAVRICKLQLYENAGTKVLVPFFVHLRRFADLSRGWGIGEDTFEFWSWVARQYRIFGEVLEIAQANGFAIPAMPEPTYPALPTTNVLPPAPEEMTMPTSSANPLHVLHPPAFYFYTAATCTIERKARYDAAVESERASGSSGLAAAPGFANEKSVNHTALIVDLLGKASTLFTGEHASLALHIAFRTAQVQAAGGQYEMATKTLKTLHEALAEGERESWPPLAAQLKSTWLECAQATGDVETAVRLLADMLVANDRQDELLGLLTTTKPSVDEPVYLTSQPVTLRAGFRWAEAPTASPVPFQVSLDPAGAIGRLQFSKLRLSLSDGTEVEISHADGAREVSLGAVSGRKDASAPLTFDGPLILNGIVTADSPAEIDVLCAELVMEQHGWHLIWRLDPAPLHTWAVGGKSFMPVHGIFESVSFAPRPHAVTLDLSFPPVGFVGEAVPISVRVKSEDERSLSLSLSVLLQPGDEPDDSAIAAGTDRSDSLLKIPLALVDGVAATSFTLYSPTPQTKMVDVSVLSSTSPTTAPEDYFDEMGADVAEITRTAVLPIIEPFALSTSSHVQRTGALLAATLSVPGPRGVVVTNVELQGDVKASSSLASAKWPQTWDSASQFGLAAKLALAPRAPPANASLVVSWHPLPDSSSPPPETLTTTLALPPLHPPPPEAFVTAILSSPATVRAHTPFPLSLAISNTHPDAEAWVTVQGETADAFCWSGPRGARIPVPPGSRVVKLTAVPVSAGGWMQLPHVGVWLGEGTDRREVRVSAPAGVLVQP